MVSSIKVAEAAARPNVNIFNVSGQAQEKVALPAVFRAPVRSDLVQFVHTQAAKNHRQPYAVSPDAGVQVAATSWGPGRAVARVPRVHGSGTGRASQGAFGNMCRGGHMYAPNTTLRRWNRKVNVNMRRYAVASALAASAVPAFVMARGHRVSQVPELPLVVSGLEGMQKTRDVIACLEKLGAMEDVERCANSTSIRAGKGKMRNRRYRTSVGPLLVFNEDNGVFKASRNLPGVDCVNVDSLSVLNLAPGGHMGRFVVFTEEAFRKLEALWGNTQQGSSMKKGYFLPTSVSSTGDLDRIIKSEEIQSVIRAPKGARTIKITRRNPLRNKKAMARLNPTE